MQRTRQGYKYFINMDPETWERETGSKPPEARRYSRPNVRPMPILDVQIKEKKRKYKAVKIQMTLDDWGVTTADEESNLEQERSHDVSPIHGRVSRLELNSRTCADPLAT